jgi:hypothetical protein
MGLFAIPRYAASLCAEICRRHRPSACAIASLQAEDHLEIKFKAPAMGKHRSDDKSTPGPLDNPPSSAPTASPRADIDRFLDQVKALGPAAKAGRRGRLIFALDATMSRQPTWDQACRLQAEMFREAAAVGGLDIQLVYYRGLAECRASSWIADSDRLGPLMSGIDCRGGPTQIAKVLAHALRENERGKIAVLVFVGDAMEESLDELCARAGELGLRTVKAFMFQEGYDPICEQAFREIARLTGGAFCRFAPGAAHELADLLRAAAAYAAGGLTALAELKAYGPAVARLIEQLK